MILTFHLPPRTRGQVSGNFDNLPECLFSLYTWYGPENWGNIKKFGSPDTEKLDR